MDEATGYLSLSLNLPFQLGFELDAMVPKCHSEKGKFDFGANLAGNSVVAFKHKLMYNLQCKSKFYL